MNVENQQHHRQSIDFLCCFCLLFNLPALIFCAQPGQCKADSTTLLSSYLAGQNDVESCYRFLDRLEQWRDEANLSENSDSTYCYFIQKALINHRLAELQVDQLSELALLRLQELALDQLMLAKNISSTNHLFFSHVDGKGEFRLLQFLQSYWLQAYIKMKTTRDHQALTTTSLTDFFCKNGCGADQDLILSPERNERFFLLGLCFYHRQK